MSYFWKKEFLRGFSSVYISGRRSVGSTTSGERGADAHGIHEKNPRDHAFGYAGKAKAQWCFTVSVPNG